MREWSEEHNDFVIRDYDLEMEIFDSLPPALRKAIASAPHGWCLRDLLPQMQGAPLGAVIRFLSTTHPAVIRQKWVGDHPQLTEPGKKI